MTAVLLHLNNRTFQQDLFALSKNDRNQAINTLRKLSQMTWEQMYSNRGLKWEKVLSRTGPNGESLYTIRITQSCRCVVKRDAEWIVLLAIHTDHNSAYE